MTFPRIVFWRFSIIIWVKKTKRVSSDQSSWFRIQYVKNIFFDNFPQKISCYWKIVSIITVFKNLWKTNISVKDLILTWSAAASFLEHLDQIVSTECASLILHFQLRVSLARELALNEPFFFAIHFHPSRFLTHIVFKSSHILRFNQKWREEKAVDFHVSEKFE